MSIYKRKLYARGCAKMLMSCGHLLTTADLKYQFIADHCHEYPIRVQCRAFDVSESGYYAWTTRPASAHEREDATRAALIQQPFLEHHQVYGSPRIHALLAALS